MDPSITTNPLGKEFHLIPAKTSSLDPDVDVSITVVPPENPDSTATIIINPSSNDNDLTVTPAFPNFPTDEEVVLTPEPITFLEPSNKALEQETTSTASLPATLRPSQQRIQLVDELKYLLTATNSLATPSIVTQTSQEADATIKLRARTLDDDVSNNAQRLLIEELTPDEEKSLGAADRRSIAGRGHRSSNFSQVSDRPRARSTQLIPETRSQSESPPTILIAQPEHRTFLNHLSGLTWAFLAAYAFSIILFLTKLCGIDLIFGFFLQMVVQTIAFGVYAFYKGYNILGPPGHRIAVFSRALLIGIGALTSFLAYYYITLPDLSAIRQSQVVLSIILSIFLLHERITISRIIACILTIIAIVVLIRPTTLGALPAETVNLTNHKSAWVPYSSSWNYLIGISLALCTAITYSIASTMNKIYFSTQHLHNTVLCFWSAVSALIISIILVCVTHFVLNDARSFPHDWRLFVGVGLAVASIFVFIANQKAIKRERSSIVTLIYSTDIILALILQNVFTHIKSDIVVILGCILILTSILIICIEVLLVEKRKNTMAIQVAQVASTAGENPSIEKKGKKRLSI